MEFQGTQRFERIRHIGTGGMGSVYEVLDRQRGMRLALKTLTGASGTDLYRFKREFRSLADLKHPNLVTLFELISEDDLWFFTMEYVRGVPFHAHVSAPDPTSRPSVVRRRLSDAPTVLDTGEDTWLSGRRTPNTGPEDPTCAPAETLPAAPPEPEALRRVFRQLCQGVHALHATGRIHRDLKPSNVLVDDAERVVILDFGLAKETGRGSVTGGGLSGTPAYMAPEQALESEPQPASDWYAVGIMLYQALTGQVPFEGSIFEVLVRKQNEEPPPPAACDPRVDEPLSALCADLLRRRPEDRPDGAEILRRLGVDPSSPARGGAGSGSFADPGAFAGSGSFAGSGAFAGSGSFAGPGSSVGPASGAPGHRPAPAFVGRQRELDHLAAVHARMLEGALTFVLLQGPSGIGKTYLADRFLAALPGGEGGTAPPLVLRGRCHERETVPYKAFDAIVDDLSRHLMELDEGDQTFVLPDDVQYLVEIFPVLRRLRLVADPRYDKPPLRDARELRNYAFVALRELLSRLGRLRPLVLFIDDLQWADHDSFALLEALIQQPGAPAMELLATCRPISPETGYSLAPRLERLQARGDAEVLELRPLPAADSRELAARLLDELFREDSGEPGHAREPGRAAEPGHAGEAASALRARITRSIAREAGGNPFFVAELVRYLADPKRGVPTSEPQVLDSLRLDRLLMDRMRALSDESQQVLQAVAVAGDPLPQSVIAEAGRMEIPSPAWDVSIAALADSRLVRQHGLCASDPVEPYHDRVREAVLASLEPEHVRRLHGRLAASIERWDPRRIDMLARHFMAADQPDAAKRYVREAAAQAQAKLAFERAAALYEAALELESDLASRPALLRALGDCLANAGRSAQAAEAYQRAAAVVEPAEADALTHLAAAQYLRGGHIARGMDVMEGVLESVGLRVATTAWGATLSVASRLGYLRLRGTRFRERPPTAIRERDRRRLDVLWSANVGLAVVDVVRSTDLLVRFVIKALEEGDRYRVAQGLALLGSQLAGMGPGYFGWARAYVNEADVLARRIEDPALRGLVWMSRCLVRYFEGDFSTVADELVEVEQHFLDHCHGVSWELAMTRSFMCWALRMSGRLRELSERFDQYSADAERTGDLYQVANLRTYQSLVWLARDDLARARRDIEGVLDAWPKDMYQVQHLFHLYARCEQALYAEQPREAWAHLRAEQRRVEASGLLRVSGLKLEFSRIRGRVHLGMAETLRGARRRPHLKEAHRCAKILIHAEHQSASAMGRFLEAGARWLTPGTPRDQARLALERAVATGEAAGTQLLTASAKHWLGELRGDEEGRRLSAEAVDWMAEQGVRNPPRLAHMLVPGYRPRH